MNWNEPPKLVGKLIDGVAISIAIVIAIVVYCIWFVIAPFILIGKLWTKIKKLKKKK